MICRSPLFLGSFLAALLLAPPMANAQPSATKSERPLAQSLQGPAKEAYTTAGVMFRQGSFAGAEKKYSEAYDLSKDSRLIFNMAACEKELHHYARMGVLLQRYKKESGANLSAEDRATVDEALAVLPRFVGQVAMSIEVPGATVLVDGDEVGTTPLASPVLLDPGKHAVAIRKEGFETSERSISVSAGESMVLTIPVASKDAQVRGPAQEGSLPPSDAPAPAPASGARWSPLVWGGFGLAGAGLVVGSVTGALALGQASSLSTRCQGKACPPNANDDLQAGLTLATVSTVSFVAMGGGAAVGAAALLLSPRHAEGAKSAAVVPWVGAGTAGIAGAF